MERPFETCRVLFQNIINLRYCASGWFYYKNILLCTVLQTLNRCVYIYIYIYIYINLTIVGPSIVIYFYSKSNQMHSNSNLFYFGTTLYMFRTVSPSIIRSLRLYIQHHTIQVLWLLASKQPQNLYDTYLMLYV